MFCKSTNWYHSYNSRLYLVPRSLSSGRLQTLRKRALLVAHGARYWYANVFGSVSCGEALPSETMPGCLMLRPMGGLTLRGAVVNDNDRTRPLSAHMCSRWTVTVEVRLTPEWYICVVERSAAGTDPLVCVFGGAVVYIYVPLSSLIMVCIYCSHARDK